MIFLLEICVLVGMPYLLLLRLDLSEVGITLFVYWAHLPIVFHRLYSEVHRSQNLPFALVLFYASKGIGVIGEQLAILLS